MMRTRLHLLCLPLLLSQTATTAPAPVSVTQTTNAGGTAYNILFPGYYGVQMGSGDRFIGGADFHGLVGFWDLKNDPTQRYNLAAMNVGLIEYQWGLNNADGSLRILEYKNSPGIITILENNDVRVRLRFSGSARAFGDANFAADPSISINEYYVFYRPDKIYQTIKLSNSNADGKGPFTVRYWEYIPKVSWLHVSNEPETLGAWGGHSCNGSNLYTPFTPSPWLYHYQDPISDYRNKTYILYSPFGTSAWPPNNPCFNAPPTPGDISVCTHFGCTPSGISSHVTVRSSFLGVIGQNSGTYIANPFQYFMGARARIQQSAPPLPTGTDVLVRNSALFVGDNGIQTKVDAIPVVDEYRNPPPLTMQVGSNQGFSKELGDYELTASGSIVDFTTGGTLRNPVFNIASWSIGIPALILAGTNPLALGQDYIAVADQGRLLIQILTTIPSGTRLQIPAPSGTNHPPSNVTLTIPTSTSFSAPATVSLSGAATDSDGTITQISFYESTNLLGTVTQAPFHFTWSNVPAGTYSLTARATDNAGATRASTAQSLVVSAPAPVSPVNAALQNITVFPNPWRQDRHSNAPITFSNLSGNLEINIFTISGHLVRKISTTATTATWDLTNKSGDRIAAGIYIYSISDGRGGQTRGKLAVVR